MGFFGDFVEDVFSAPQRALCATIGHEYRRDGNVKVCLHCGRERKVND